MADKVLGLVSEKTGYGRDMLDLDLDLEADLGIDTVKQAEVFAMVRETFGIPRQDDIKLRDYPTLKHVIDFVRKHRPELKTATPPTAPAAATPEPSPAATAKGPLFRRPVAVPRPPLEVCKPTSARLAKGTRAVVVADRGGTGKALAETLTKRGVTVLLIDDQPSREELGSRLAKWANGTKAPIGAYFLAALDAEPPVAEMDLAAWRHAHAERVKLACALGRALYDGLGSEGSFFVAATRLGGLHGYEAGGAQSPCGGAVVGFTKALGRERPAALVKAIDFELGAKPAAVAAALVAETERDPATVEVGYRGGLRFAVAVRPEPAESIRSAGKKPLALDAKTVFLVTGGAGAITTAIVADLARACKGTFHLLDARPAPDEATRADLGRLAEDKEALKREIFARLKAEGQRATPAAVEKRLFDLERAAAILEAIRDIEAAGGRAHYHSVDVTNAEAMATVVGGIRAREGRLDVVLHAAGLERSRSLDQKPIEEWDLVFDVKADGLFNLIRATQGMEVGAIVGFSSVAGRFGNAGQTDYSAANDLLCKMASSWGAAHPGLAMVFDWTAWGGIGMATRGSIPEMMRRAGIEMLDPAEAIPVIRDRLTAGFSGEAVVGRRLGILLEERDQDAGIEPKALAPRAGLPLDVKSIGLHDGLRAEITVDPQTEPFLRDHEIDGTPVLPGVMGLEVFAEVATLLCPGYRVAAIEAVRFHAPLKYYRRQPRPAVVQALATLDADGKVRVRTTLSSSQAIVGSNQPPEEKIHFSATVVLERGKAASPARVTAAPIGDGRRIDREAIYRVYFHGPAYQVLSRVAPRADGGLAGAMARSLPADLASPEAALVFSPRLVELCFQTAGVWEIGSTGQLGLPAAVDRVTVWQQPAGGASLVAEVFPHNGGETVSFDAHVRDPEGRVYVEVKGYRTARLPGALPESQIEPFRTVVQPV